MSNTYHVSINKLVKTKPDLKIEGMELNKKESFVISEIIKRNEQNNRTPDLFVNIHTDILRNYLREAYKEILVDMESRGLIEINGSYEVGSNSKSYRLGKDWRYGKVVENFYQQQRAVQHSGNVVIQNPVQQHIYDSLNQVTVETSPLELETKTPSRKARVVTSAQKFLAKEIDFKKGENSNRIYHSYLSCPKEGRKIFSLNGEPLVTLDIKNAHPFLCLSFYNEINNPVEMSEYINALKGDIYQLIDGDREEIKIQWCKFLSGGDFNHNNPVEDYVKKNFPSLYQFLLKQKDLALTLQNMEADIMISTVAKKCMLRSIPIITEHDGCSVPEQYEETVIHLIIDAVNERIGHKPTVTKK